MEQVNSRFNDACFSTQGTSEHGYYPGKQNHAILLQGQLVKLKRLCHHIILIIVIITCLRSFVVRQIGTWLVLTKIQANTCITVTQSALLDNVGSNFEHPGLKRSTLDFTPFFTLTLVIQRTLPRAPFLGHMLCVERLKVLKRECLSERYNPIIVQGNSEQKLELYHLCWLTTKLKMQQNPNLFPRCSWLGIWPEYNFKKWTNTVVPLKDGPLIIIVGNATNINVCLGDVSAEEWQGWPMYNDSVYLTKLSAMA